MATILELTSLTIPQLFFEFFLPFALTLVIIYAVLQMTRLFKSKINLMISLIVSIMVATTPLFGTMASMISRWGSYTALIAFIAVFIIGIGAWAFRRGSEYLGGAIEAERDLRRLYKRRAKLLNEIERTSDDNKRAAKYDEAEDIDKRIRRRTMEVRHHRRL
jgi:hypothetical protein